MRIEESYKVFVDLRMRMLDMIQVMDRSLAAILKKR